VTSVMSLTLLYVVIARSLSDAAISKRNSFVSLGMTHVRLFIWTGHQERVCGS